MHPHIHTHTHTHMYTFYQQIPRWHTRQPISGSEEEGCHGSTSRSMLPHDQRRDAAAAPPPSLPAPSSCLCATVRTQPSAAPALPPALPILCSHIHYSTMESQVPFWFSGGQWGAIFCIHCIQSIVHVPTPMEWLWGTSIINRSLQYIAANCLGRRLSQQSREWKPNQMLTDISFLFWEAQISFSFYFELR